MGSRVEREDTLGDNESGMADIIVGRNAVLEALKAERTIERISLVEGARSDTRLTEIGRLARVKGIQIEHVRRHALNGEGGYGVHQGVVAYAVRRPRLTLKDLFVTATHEDESGLYVILDGVEDPHNLGAVLRTAEAIGAHGVITRSRRAVGITPAVVKAAAGAAEYVSLVEVPNIVQAIGTMKKKGVWITGIDMTGKVDYTRIDYTLPTGIVIGAEGKGISALVRSKCDFLASIPMRGKITSLNTSVAAAVVLYEALKQRMRRHQTSLPDSGVSKQAF
jgi:23S rRNA (guanosine2251-2'-O)-methyltransferase